MQYSKKVIYLISFSLFCAFVLPTEPVKAMSIESQQVIHDMDEQDYLSEPITRAEFIVLLMRSFEDEISYGEGSYVFTDAGMETSYGYYVQAAFYMKVIEGIWTGDNYYFMPLDPLTREQAAVILSRFLSSLDMKVEKESLHFKDEGSIAPWAKKHVKVVSAAGLIVGDGIGLFKPKEVITHEMADALITRLKKLDSPYFGGISSISDY